MFDSICLMMIGCKRMEFWKPNWIRRRIKEVKQRETWSWKVYRSRRRIGLTFSGEVGFANHHDDVWKTSAKPDCYCRSTWSWWWRSAAFPQFVANVNEEKGRKLVLSWKVNLTRIFEVKTTRYIYNIYNVYIERDRFSVTDGWIDRRRLKTIHFLLRK